MNRRCYGPLFLAVFSWSVFGAEFLPPGHRPIPPGVHALVGAKVVVKPGQVIDGATIVIRDGLIQAVGKDLAPPADARVRQLKGATIYAGFIDACLSFDSTNRPVTTTGLETGSVPAAGGVNFFGVPGADRDHARAGPGYEVAPVKPEERVARNFAPDKKLLASARELGFTAGNVIPEKGIVRGTSAFVALSDVGPNEAIIKPDTFQHVAFDTGGGRTEAYPRSLMGVIAVVRQTIFDARHYAREQEWLLHHQPQRGTRPEFNPSLESLARAVVREMPVVFEPGSALMVDRAGRVARELELNFYIQACGQEWRRPDLAKAAAVPFIVPLNFPELPKLPDDGDWDQVSLDQLRAWDWAPENAALLRQQGLEIALTCYGLGDRKNFRRNLRLALDRGLSADDALAALTVNPAKLCGVEDRFGTIEAGKVANLTVVAGDGYFNPENQVSEVWIDGRVYLVRAGEAPARPKKDAVDAENETALKSREKASLAEARELRKQRLARSPMEGRGPAAAPPAILVEGATIWTCGPEGRLENADLLIERGKVKAVGRGLASRSDRSTSPMVIDGRGRHVTPGIIDAHNHSLILGAVNEATLPSTAMVRIGDVINSESLNVHSQLAGGLTTLNLLHGSANPIGGQNAVLKLRDGLDPDAMKFSNAPPGIKFALGENVKQSNWGERNTNRFPQTRMGVGTFFANRFTAARQYLKEWDDYNQEGVGRAPGRPEPRRNLELEALSEVLQGKRWIHCHSYRQDEILAFLRTLEFFHVQVGTLQHILEGYKVADEIAKHGAGASSFADWWAYKFEVYDAIPFNGSLMRERGVLVSFNSDSSDLSRRLYLEAAKAVKYGATPEIEALKFVTLNPARQLRIDPFVGSLEPGKDADFVIWSKSPLDSTTVCLQTWIEGKKYFDRELEAARSKALEEERAALLEKARKIQARGGASEGGEKEKEKFFELPLEHRYDNQDRHCLEEEH